MLPRDGAMDTGAMLASARDGSVAMLSILGANPVLHYPDGEFVREAIGKVPFVVVSDLFMTETAQMATLVLPAKGPFEKTGTTTNVTGEVLPVNAAASLEIPPGALSDMEMLVGLAGELGVALPSIEELDETVIGKLAAAPEPFMFGDGRFGGASAALGRGSIPHHDDSIPHHDDSIPHHDECRYLTMTKRVAVMIPFLTMTDRVAVMKTACCALRCRRGSLRVVVRARMTSVLRNCAVCPKRRSLLLTPRR